MEKRKVQSAPKRGSIPRKAAKEAVKAVLKEGRESVQEVYGPNTKKLRLG
jgi:CII-binding regulator of phage lambda lysogenization HflD